MSDIKSHCKKGKTGRSQNSYDTCLSIGANLNNSHQLDGSFLVVNYVVIHVVQSSFRCMASL